MVFFLNVFCILKNVYIFQTSEMQNSDKIKYFSLCTFALNFYRWIDLMFLELLRHVDSLYVLYLKPCKNLSYFFTVFNEYIVFFFVIMLVMCQSNF